MESDVKNKSIRLVSNLYKAMKELSTHWTESGQYNSDLLAESGYPFDISFDELTEEVGVWLDTMKNSLEPINGYFEKQVDMGGKATMWFKNGQLDGIYKVFDINGKVRTINSYRDGVVNNFSVVISENGEVQYINLNEANDEQFGSLLLELISASKLEKYDNDFRLSLDTLDGTISLNSNSSHIFCTPFWEDTKGIAVEFEYGVFHSDLLLDMPKTNEEITDFINKYHNVYVPMVIAMEGKFRESSNYLSL